MGEIMSFNYETGLYEGYIYMLENPMNKKIYIGQTSRNLAERMKDHKYEIHKGTSKNKMYTDMKDIDISEFNVYVIETIKCENQDDLHKLLDDKEYYYIELYNSDDTAIGYNDALGGHVVRHSVKNIKQYEPDGKFIKQWRTPATAARNLNISVSGIYNCCNGIIKTSGGYVWRKQEDSFDKYETVRKTKTVKRYDINGNLINIYHNLEEAALDNNCSITTVRNICTNYLGLTHFKNYVFRYGNDSFDKYDIVFKTYGKQVVQLTQDKQYISKYDNVKIASELTGVDSSTICKVCNKYENRQTAGGYRWMWMTDYNKNV